MSWKYNCLNGRTKPKVILNGCKATEGLSCSVTKGVAQGSIVGPTLFSIYINNIAQAVGSSLIHLYADDTVLYSAGHSLDFVLNTPQQSFLSVKTSFLCTEPCP
jgi:hypothetical protein